MYPLDDLAWLELKDEETARRGESSLGGRSLFARNLIDREGNALDADRAVGRRLAIAPGAQRDAWQRRRRRGIGRHSGSR